MKDAALEKEGTTLIGDSASDVCSCALFEGISPMVRACDDAILGLGKSQGRLSEKVSALTAALEPLGEKGCLPSFEEHSKRLGNARESLARVNAKLARIKSRLHSTATLLEKREARATAK